MRRAARGGLRAVRPRDEEKEAPAGDDLSERLARAESQAREWERRFRQHDAHLAVLERERQKLSAIVNHADAAFLVFDASFRLVWANSLFSQRYGGGEVEPKDREAVAPLRIAPAIGSECSVVLGGAEHSATCPVHRAFASGNVAHSEMKFLVGGRERDIYATAMPIRSTSGAVEEALVMLQDVSDLEVLRRSQADLRASEERFRSIFENTSAGMAAVGLDGTLLQVNPAFCRFLGMEESELSGRDLADITHPDDRLSARRLFASDPGAAPTASLTEMRYIRKDGSTAWGLTSATRLRDAAGRPSCAVALVQDVEERKQTEEALRRSEEQLRQSQKIEAIGRLAGGVAHDFNNLLTVITGRCALLLRRPEGAGPVRSEIEVIRDTAERAATLTRQLLAFSRKQMLVPRVVDVNTIVAEMEPMLRRLIGEDLRLASSLRPDLGRVRVDPGQLEQIIMNLAINARDAMPHGGRLTIDTDNEILTADSHFNDVQVVPGRYVLLAVTDTGIGMDAATRARIFEPFFTTKAPGTGTGLGLSTVYGIVKQSGGYIFVESEPNQGAIFKIYLPRVDGSAEQDQTSAPDDIAPRGTGTILLVEDEEVVRNLTREILEHVGYTVLSASGAAEARALCQSHDGPIQLLLADVVMPEMGGRELAMALAPLRPEMRVLYMSGYTDNAAILHGVAESGSAFLQKPFTPAGLAHKVREVLDGRPA
ncbi:MAG TPA: PAS domain S-box protein [Candidatus Cryosericum sp.]|nr:PAS domain S-box protein [Candidatus Cryosericum sp.]